MVTSHLDEQAARPAKSLGGGGRPHEIIQSEQEERITRSIF
jgi:hypothetical protein